MVKKKSITEVVKNCAIKHMVASFYVLQISLTFTVNKEKKINWNNRPTKLLKSSFYCLKTALKTQMVKRNVEEEGNGYINDKSPNVKCHTGKLRELNGKI